MHHMLPISHKYLTDISSKSKSYLRHLNLGITRKSSLHPVIKKSLHFKFWTFRPPPPFCDSLFIASLLYYPNTWSTWCRLSGVYICECFNRGDWLTVMIIFNIRLFLIWRKKIIPDQGTKRRPFTSLIYSIVQAYVYCLFSILKDWRKNKKILLFAFFISSFLLLLDKWNNISAVLVKLACQSSASLLPLPVSWSWERRDGGGFLGDKVEMVAVSPPDQVPVWVPAQEPQQNLQAYFLHGAAEQEPLWSLGCVRADSLIQLQLPS